ASAARRAPGGGSGCPPRLAPASARARGRSGAPRARAAGPPRASTRAAANGAAPPGPAPSPCSAAAEAALRPRRPEPGHGAHLRPAPRWFPAPSPWGCHLRSDTPDIDQGDGQVKPGSEPDADVALDDDAVELERVDRARRVVRRGGAEPR